MSATGDRFQAVGVFCGSSDGGDPGYALAAAELGRALAAGDLKLVYGGGGVGLMGACARAAHEAGGRVLGVIPDFLTNRERALDVVETVVVASMHDRKRMMYDAADAYVALPGGVGTLEEVVELLSWRRLDLHRKPLVFYSPNGFWEPLFALFRHTVEAGLTPPDFLESWVSVERIEEVVPAILRQAPAPKPEAPSRIL
jgi:uncharacterized protein (TIGR00730 family)